MEHVKKRDRDKAEIAEVDGAFKASAQGLQRIEFLRPDEKCIAVAPRRPTDRTRQRWAFLTYRKFMLRAVLRQQGEEKICVPEPRPRNIAGKLVSFRRFRRRFTADLVVDQRDKSLKRRTMIEQGVVALFGQEKLRNRRRAVGDLNRNIELNRIHGTGKSQGFGDRCTGGGLSLKNQCRFGVAGQFNIAALNRVNQFVVVKRRGSLPTDA